MYSCVLFVILLMQTNQFTFVEFWPSALQGQTRICYLVVFLLFAKGKAEGEQ